MRTHILISLGATLLMCLSIWLPQTHMGMRNGDPGRIAAQVVSGIGFLGAGAILKLGSTVRGLTTAASLWITAAIGMGFGAGLILPSILAAVLDFITLYVLNIAEHHLFPAERTKIITITYRAVLPETNAVVAVLKTEGMRIHTVDIEYQAECVDGGGTIARLSVLAGVTAPLDIARLISALRSTGAIESVTSQEHSS
jgi:putative Mg2+ transporter-C (MgtC) family protein